MNVDNRAAADIRPMTRDRAVEVAGRELREFRDLVGTLERVDWGRPTANTGWNVRDVVAHVVGQYQELARIGTFLRRLRTARKRYPDRIALDGRNQVQIDELADKSSTDLLACLDRFGPAGLRAIRRMPSVVRRMPSTWFFPEPALPDHRLSYLFDVLTSRDTWMHRVDIAHATAKPLDIDEHDQQIVAQVIRDLDRRWNGPTIVFDLTGPAGGVWTVGTGTATDTIRVEALDMMLHLSGRTTPDLRPPSPVAAARVIF
jgi:uncharacterized protein (TIGR03083 family)